MAGTTNLYGEERASLRKEREAAAAAAKEDRKLELRLGPPVDDDVVRESTHAEFQKGFPSNEAVMARTTHKRY